MDIRITTLMLPIRPRVRVSAVVTDERGEPLSRRVICYDTAQKVVAEAVSGADGYVAFERDGNINDRYILRAVGKRSECDDISCPVRGDFI